MGDCARTPVAHRPKRPRKHLLEVYRTDDKYTELPLNCRTGVVGRVGYCLNLNMRTERRPFMRYNFYYYFKTQIIQRRKFNNVTLVSYFLNYFTDTKATLDKWVFGLYFDADPISTPCRNRVRVEIESILRTLFRHYQIASSCSA